MIVLTIIAWYIVGLIGSAITLEFSWRRGSYSLDITVGTIIFGMVIAIFGPLMLVLSFITFVGWVFAKYVDINRVVFRGKQ